MSHAPAATALVDLNEIAKIELLVLRRLAGGVTGDHRSRADGAGFDFVGLRDWQAGDRFSAIDWPQSTLTNFAPLVVREFDQPSTATVLAVADASLSTRCGAGGDAAGGRRRPRRGDHRPLGHLLPGPLRAAHLRTRLRRRRRGGPAHRPQPRRPLPGSLRVAPRPRAGRRRRGRRCGGGRQRADDRPGAGHLRLPVRRRPRRRPRAGTGQRHPRRVPGARRQRLGVRDAAHRVAGGSPCTTSRAASRGSISRRAYRGPDDAGRRLAGPGGARRPRRRARRRRARAETSARASWRWPSSSPSVGCGGCGDDRAPGAWRASRRPAS